MSLAEHLIEKGHTEGIEKGIEKGVSGGKLTLLQELMGKPISSQADLSVISVEELQARYLELDAEYKRLFKKV